MSVRHPCPCCGSRTVEQAPPGTWSTCPVCYWTDEELGDDAAWQRLFEAQHSFEQIGASSRDWKDQVRAPRPDEARPADWEAPVGPGGGGSPREAARERIRAAIVEAFSSVSPEGRVPLRAAYHHDFDLEPRIDWDDRDQRWVDIPDDVLDFYGTGTSVFVFGTPAGFRYYLPAFLLHALRAGRATEAMLVLDLPPRSGVRPADRDEVTILDGRQRAAVRQYLEYVVLYERPAPWAERALERVWNRVAGPESDGG